MTRTEKAQPKKKPTRRKKPAPAKKAPTGKPESVYVPKTEYGRLLMAARSEYIASGGKLLTIEEVREEARRLKGGSKWEAD